MYKNPIPVSKERDAGKRLVRAKGFGFAAGSPVVPVYAAELAHIAVECPIAFLQEENAFSPVALMSLDGEGNLFVGPDGRWLGGYVPAALRRYPFVLGRPPQGGELVLCIDSESGLLSDTEGEPLYSEDGQPSKYVSDVVGFLGELERSRAVVRSACAALERHGLIVSWPLRVPSEAGAKDVAGLFRIDEAGFNQLSEEAFLDLRRAGALPLVYAHLISTQRLSVLDKLRTIQASLRRQAQPPAAAPVLDMNEMFESPATAGDFVFKF